MKSLSKPQVIFDIGCCTGPSLLFSNIAKCDGKFFAYIFGDPYCKKCHDELCKIHSQINKTNK